MDLQPIAEIGVAENIDNGVLEWWNKDTSEQNGRIPTSWIWVPVFTAIVTKWLRIKM